jgi:hypothetical protein
MDVKKLLEKLKIAIRSGALTPTNKVDAGTFVCLKETNNKGEITNYWQAVYEALPYQFQTSLKDKTKGHTVTSVDGCRIYKVIAIFDSWNEEEKSA